VAKVFKRIQANEAGLYLLAPERGAAEVGCIIIARSSHLRQFKAVLSGGKPEVETGPT